MSHSITEPILERQKLPGMCSSLSRGCGKWKHLRLFKAQALNWYVVIVAHILLAEASHMAKSSVSELGSHRGCGREYLVYSNTLQ